MRTVRVASTDKPFTVEIETDQHRWLGDEPPENGGSDLGPSPFDMLLGSLGACTVITMEMYARRKHWPLQSVTVSLEHERLRAEDCADCRTKRGHFSRITMNLRIAGNLEEEQLSRLRQIAERCPVKRTLEGEVQIHTASD